MNVNGSRFHLLLGEADWGRCLVRAGDGVDEPNSRLDDLWKATITHSDSTLQTSPLAWDATRYELCLQSEPIILGTTPGEIPFTLAARRAAAADRNGNIYWIDADPSRLRVWSAGSDRESAFWPDGPANCRDLQHPVLSDFEPVETSAGNEQKFTALTVTDDHYLVVGFTTATTKGLLIFDLMSGGPPVENLWSASVPFVPFDMAQRCSGGAWVLDLEHARLWELDRRLAVVSRAQDSNTLTPPELAIFQSAKSEFGLSNDAPRQQPAPVFPAGIDLAAVIGEKIDPIAVEVSEDGSVLILDRNQVASSSRIFCLQRQGDTVKAFEPVQLKQLAQDFVVAWRPCRA